MNTYIRAKEVRLIGPDSTQLGIVSTQEALHKAREVGLDLVEVSSQSVPPVCRIMDFGKYKFEKAKREKEARKKQKVFKVKEIKMGPNISEHDYQFKLRHAKGFIEDGDKVRVAIVFHGRQITHQELGRKVMARFIEDMKELAITEQFPRMEGKMFVTIFTLNPLLKRQSKKEFHKPAAPSATPKPATPVQQAPAPVEPPSAAAIASNPATEQPENSGPETNSVSVQ
ncbi:MAG: translation initiation factor IF-3 [bacterium]|nr:translation initiation factor IF-3 [bacterium]